MKSVRKASDEEIHKAITTGIVFHPTKQYHSKNENKVKTKAKKKKYIAGVHGSDSAKMKANIRQRRLNRGKK